MKRQTIIAGASIMMVAALLSRLLGWVRDRAIANYWGATLHTDAYWAAFMVPDLLYYLLAGGAVGAAVIPVFSAYLRRGEEQRSWRAANSILTLFTLLAILGVALIVIFAHPLVTIVAPGFGKKLGPAQVTECAGYVRLLAPMVLFTVISAFFTGILQAHRHFTAPAFAWIVYNFGIIGGAFIGGHWINRYPKDSSGLLVLCMGVVAGAFLLVAVQLPSMIARGFRYRPSLDLTDSGVREVLRLFLPYMAGLAFTQICLLWLPSFFGSYFPGGVTSLRYANRLVVLPLGLFGIAISTAVFPTLAERVDAGEMQEFRRTFSATLRAVFFLSVPSAAGLFVLAGPVLRLLWKGGEFGESAVRAAAFCLLFYIASLIGLSGLQIVNRAFYSLRDARTPPLVGIAYTAIIVLLAVVLMPTRLGYAAIAAATSVGVTIGMAVMFDLLRRRLNGIDGRAIALSFLRIALASAVLALIALAVSRWVGAALGVPATEFLSTAPAVIKTETAVTHPRTLYVLVQVLASIVAGTVSYMVALRALGAPELAAFRQIIARRRNADGPSAPSV
ncbi:MAG: murein biosynthesis integral membrane protein MurJ [Armatimonadota bacterium]